MSGRRWPAVAGGRVRRRLRAPADKVTVALSVPLSVALSVALSAALSATPAHAGDIDTLQRLNQGEFRLLSEDLGAALSFKPLIPSEPLGLIGFDVGVAVTGTRLRHRGLLERATGGADVPSMLPVPSIRVHKGLPYGIDVGVSYARVPDSNVGAVGAELRWAFIEGGVAIPAVAVRAALTRLTGVGQLDLRTRSIDLSVSKGFLNVTPYGGIGRVWTSSRPDGVPALAKESFSQGKVFAGVNLNLGVNFAFEVDRTGDVTSYGIKGGIRF